MDGVIAYYPSPEKAEEVAAVLRSHAKVKTDVFHVKHDPERGYYIVQDVA